MSKDRIKKLMEMMKGIGNPKKYFSLEDEIDDLDLTLFQKAFLKDINYFNDTKGQYKFIQKYVVDKYNRILNEDELVDEVNYLINAEYIDVRVKKSIYNGKYVTFKLMDVNYDNLELHPENYKE
jgi:hypothetical protein